MAWSRDGTKLATVGRDGTIKVYEPRSSTSPIKVRNYLIPPQTIWSPYRKAHGLLVVMELVWSG